MTTYAATGTGPEAYECTWCPAGRSGHRIAGHHPPGIVADVADALAGHTDDGLVSAIESHIVTGR